MCIDQNVNDWKFKDIYTNICCKYLVNGNLHFAEVISFFIHIGDDKQLFTQFIFNESNVYLVLKLLWLKVNFHNYYVVKQYTQYDFGSISMGYFIEMFFFVFTVFWGVISNKP